MRLRGGSRISALVALLLALLPIPVVAGSAPAAAAAGPRIMVVGDSISQGLEGDFTWRYRLSQHFARTGTAVDFVGPWQGTTRLPGPGEGPPPFHDGGYRPGISFDSDNLAQWGWQMHQAAPRIQADAAAAAPDYVLVELGFNDLGWWVSDANGLWADLQVFLTGLQNAAAASGRTIRVAVATVPQRSPIAGRDDLPPAIDAYNALLRSRLGELALTRPGLSLALADLAAAYDYRTDAYDGLHPGVRGEYVIAGVFARTLNTTWGLGGVPAAIPAAGDLDAPLPLTQPGSLTAVPEANGVRLTWAHTFGTGGYRLYQRNVTAGETGFTALPLPIADTTWLAAPLPAGMVAEFYVVAERGDRAGAGHSPIGRATVGGVAPGASAQSCPGAVTGVQEHQATVAWSAASNATGYILTVNHLGTGVADELPIAVPGTSFSPGLLQAGTWYRVDVTPVNGYLRGPVMRGCVFRTLGTSVYEVVGLGESYSSGLGAGDYDDHQCFASAYAWPRAIMSSQASYRRLFACKGASIADVRGQIDRLRALPRIGNRLVTVTVGGIDAQFGPEIQNCLLTALDCSSREATIAQRVDALKPDLVALYQTLKAASPNSDILIVGYPRLLSPNAPDLTLLPAEIAMVRRLVDRMNEVIRDAARIAGLPSAIDEVVQRFDGKEALCSLNLDNCWIWPARIVIDGGIQTDESFHPNRAGQIAYAIAVNEAMDSYGRTAHFGP